MLLRAPKGRLEHYYPWRSKHLGITCYRPPYYARTHQGSFVVACHQEAGTLHSESYRTIVVSI